MTVVPSCFHFVIIPLQLTVEYLVARTFHRWTYCTGGNLSRYCA
ncbi:unnamed protein product [Staurois parvus]|uniref:Uncharacterized protein n=1 Tax=Staurois parvus TaxID=386267 RepID=A0ABN9HQE1_9NEOB|nr:unnamed protein product [Staurois parvus]